MKGKNCNCQAQKLIVTHHQCMTELCHRLQNTNNTLHTYDVSEATVFFPSGEQVNR
jgi:hypothetical protein